MCASTSTSAHATTYTACCRSSAPSDESNGRREPTWDLRVEAHVRNECPYVGPVRRRLGVWPAERAYRTLLFHSSSVMSTQPLLQRSAGKRIALPVRVEPKVFFANERTCTLRAANASPLVAQFHSDALGPGCGSAQLW